MPGVVSDPVRTIDTWLPGKFLAKKAATFAQVRPGLTGFSTGVHTSSYLL
jgi:hypothetical protein